MTVRLPKPMSGFGEKQAGRVDTPFESIVGFYPPVDILQYLCFQLAILPLFFAMSFCPRGMRSGIAPHR